MADHRRSHETREPQSWFADEDARWRRGTAERDDRYAYGSDRYARYESSRDDRGSRWEGPGDDRAAYGGSVGLYRTDDRLYHDRYREQADRSRPYRDDRDDRTEGNPAASEYYRAARDQRDDYLRWSALNNGTWGNQSVGDHELPSWELRERGGYWRQFEHRRPHFAGRGPKDYQRPDERIREEICDRMTDDPMLDASEISVDVKRGEVVLTGSVASRDQKRRAEDLVERVSGVRDVTNQLRVMRDGMGHERSVGAPGVHGREIASSQPAHEVGRETPGKSTSSTTT